MKEIYYSPGDVIDSMDDKNLADNSFCFVQRGRIQFKADGTRLQELHEGKYFGLDQLLLGYGVDIDVHASDFTLLYCLSHEQFLEVLREGEFQDDFERYCMLKDEIIFQNRKDVLHLKCQSCGQNNHMVAHCPLITYIPNRPLIFGKAKHNQKQVR